MRKLLIGSILLIVFTACNNSGSDKKEGGDSSGSKQETTINPVNNSLTEAEKADGWQLLFDGQSIKGWHKYGGTPAGAAWKIADGLLYLDTSSKKDWQTANGGDIVTDEEF